jgi:hypothetical protein
MKRFYYGLIWVTSKTKDEKAMAGRIRDALMTSNFAKNLVQVVKV